MEDRERRRDPEQGDADAEEPEPSWGGAEVGAGESLTRLGPWGETALAVAMVLAVLYLFTFSHSNAGFQPRARLPPGAGWAQPRPEARNWAEQHSLYAAKVATDSPELLFYGDSITELFRGTIHMEPDPRAHGVPEVWHRHFGADFRAAALGIAGDRTAQLMWRLQHGEAPRPGSTKAVVVLIGTNDLTQASFQGDEGIPAAGNATAAHVIHIVGQLRAAAPDARLLLLGLLPRGDQTLMPDPAMFEQPSKFSGAISAVNAQLRVWAEASGAAAFLDCGAGFLAEGGALDLRLMPDALHPNAAGMEILCQCLAPAVRQAMGR